MISELKTLAFCILTALGGQLMGSLALPQIPAFQAHADYRPPTPQERERLTQLVEKMGCGRFEGMEYDEEEQKFEVEEARCGDGRVYDIYFDRRYQFLGKVLDD